MAINQKRSIIRTFIDSTHNTRHQISNNDEVRNTNTEALDGNSSIEEDCRTWVCDLREGEEGRGSWLQVSGAARLQVEAEGGAAGGPDNDDYTEEHAEVSHCKWHGKGSRTNNYTV